MKVLILLGLVALVHLAKAALPNYFVPDTYVLKIEADLDDEKKTTFDGHVLLTFNTTADLPVGTRNVILHSYKLKIDTIIFKYPSSRRDLINKKNYYFNEIEQTLNITVLERLEPLKQYVLDIKYTGEVGDYYGLTRANSDKDNYLNTRLYPTYSRRLYPCMDEPGLRASYNLTLVIKSNSKLPPTFLSGIQYIGVVPSGSSDGQYARNFSSVNPIPPYGIFFTIGNYKANQNVYFPIPLDGKISNNLNLALQTSTIKSLLGLTGSDKDCTVAIVPGLSVPSESTQGIIALRPDLVLNADLPAAGTLSNVLSMTTALVKSAYGGIVSPATWNDVWISESVSAYIAKQALKEVKEWNIEDVDYVQEPLADSWSEKSSPVIPSIKGVDDTVKYLADQVAINKGAAIINMIESLKDKNEKPLVDIITENMKKGAALNSMDFLEYYQNKSKVGDNLPSGKTHLSDVINGWLEQTGYPTVNVVRKSKDVVASQTRFAYPESTNSKNTKWYIPIYSDLWSEAGDTTDDLKWLTTGENDELVLHQNADDRSSVAINTKGAGLFRVLYNEVDLNNTRDHLIDDLKSLSPEFRASFISDSLIFARRGSIKYSAALQSMNFLNSETKYLPWQAALNEFDELWSMVHFDDTLLRLFRNYATDRIRRTYMQLENVHTDDNGYLTRALLRKLIVGAQCKFEDYNCKEMARTNFDDKLPKTIYPAIACSVYSDIDNSTLIIDTLKQKYSQHQYTCINEDLFSYLACPKKNTTIVAYLNEVIKLVLATDLPMAFKAVYSKPYNLATAIKFFNDNYVVFKAKLTKCQIIQIITDFGNKGITDEHINLLRSLRPADNDTDVTAAVSASLDAMNKRQMFLKDNRDELYAGLSGYRPSPAPQPTTSTEPPLPTSSSTEGTSTPKTNSAFNFATPSLLLLLAAAAALLSLR